MLYLHLSYFLEGKLAVVETFWRDTIKSLNAFQRHQAINNEMTTQLSTKKSHQRQGNTIETRKIPKKGFLNIQDNVEPKIWDQADLNVKAHSIIS